MLTIVTGTPGAGKTLLTLHRLIKEFRDGVDEVDRRSIFVNGIPGLNYEFFDAQELEDAEKWYECPQGSIIFIDEAQRIFPQRSGPGTAQVPQKCREFETHRHRGMDIFCTTQDANTLDIHLRRMAGRHLHVKRTLGQEVATVIEYDHYQKEPNEYFNKREAVSTAPWKYPKDLYDQYKSATLHTVKKRYPLKLFIIPVSLILLAIIVYFLVSNLSSRTQALSNGSGAVSSSDYAGPAVVKPGVILQTIDSYLELHKPLIPGLLHTSPFYQSTFKAEVFPKPYCVIYQGEPDKAYDHFCKCITQQGTTYSTDDTTCRYWAIHGFFDPTLSEDNNQSRQAASGSRAAPASLNDQTLSGRRLRGFGN